MSESVRCTACRGAKKVPKLGGMVGECNLCKGVGTILWSDKFVPKVNEPVIAEQEVIGAVADCLPATTIEDQPQQVEPKLDVKRALYRRKKA